MNAVIADVRNAELLRIQTETPDITPEEAERALEQALAGDRLDARLAGRGIDGAALESRLLATSLFGIPTAVPGIPVAGESRLQTLLHRASRSHAVMVSRLAAAQDKLAGLAEDPQTACREAVLALLDETFPLTPRIQLTEDLAAAALAGQDAPAEDIDDWLIVARTVRPRAGALVQARTLADIAGTPLRPLQVYQWPAKRKRWIAAPLEDRRERLTGDNVSIVVQPVTDFAPPSVTNPAAIRGWSSMSGRNSFRPIGR